MSRGASALVTVVMVFVVSPRDMGIYAGGMLIYSLGQTLGDAAVRPTAPLLWQQPGARALLHRYARRCAWWQALLLVVYAAALRLTGTATTSQALIIGALAVAAWVSAGALPVVTYQQRLGRWAMLGRLQFVASTASLVVGVLLAPVAGIAAGVAQTLVVEALFRFLVTRRTSLPTQDEPPPTHLGRQVDPAREFRHMSATNLLGWIQGQADRTTVAMIGGAATLGIYSVGAQMARSVADPAGVGLITLLRNNLATRDAAGQKAAFDRTVRVGAALGVALQVMTLVALVLPMSLLLDAEWRPAIVAGTLLSASLPQLMVAYCMSTLLIVEGRTRDMLPWQFVGIGLGIGAGAVLVFNLVPGLLLLIGRETFAMGVRAWLTRHALTPATALTVVAASVGSVCLALAAITVL